MISRKIASLATATLLLSSTSAFAATWGVNMTAYALGDDGTSLVTITAPGMPAPMATALSFGGGKAVSLDAIAYRPNTTRLYGYDDSSDTVYEINTMTGAATAVASFSGTTNSKNVGFDFNNQLDAARLVSAENDNSVFFPNNAPPSITTAPTSLFYKPGDVNDGKNPNIVMNAYTNAVPMPTETRQFALDSNLNALTILNNNAGDLTTVGTLTLNGALFDFNEFGGFDILSYRQDDNTAFALLTSGNTQAIYSFGLEADALGQISLFKAADLPTSYGPLNGFAVAPAPVPLPAAAWGLLTGLAALFGFGRRRAKRRSLMA